MRTFPLFFVLLTTACGSEPTSTDSGAGNDTADTADTGGDTGDTGTDTGDTDSGDTDSGDIDTAELPPGCPADATAVCGTLTGTAPTKIFEIRLYPEGAELPAASALLDPTKLTITFPFGFVMKEDAFHSEGVAGTYDAVLVVDSDGDGNLERGSDTTVESPKNPIKVTEGKPTVGVDFAVP